ncbi:MAG: hypothetical protein H7831_10225 [Magnetococcus sp. WYHC-3]
MRDDRLNELLGNCDRVMQEADNAGDGGFQLKEGEYIFAVNSAEICKAKNSDRIQVKLVVTVASGPFNGFTHYSYDMRFTDAEGNPDLRAMGFAQLACSKMGLGAPRTMEEFGVAISKFENRVFIGEIKRSKEFTNLRIVRLLHENHSQWVLEGSPSGATDSDRTGW